MIDTDANGGTRSGQDGVCDKAAQPPRVLLIMAAPGTVAASLIHALEREFPWLVVERREDVAGACVSFGNPVSLILISPTLLKTAEEAAGEMARWHPNALAALIDYDDRARSFSEVSRSSLIRGVLPMNLRLDIWLSVVRLMLSGGEYFPVRMLRHHAENDHEAAGTEPRTGAAENGTIAAVHMDGLTAREIQILEMVSRGLQNKSIAAAFSLSEHTVKIHLHNIIGKLGVHNRTEAAARFRERLSGRTGTNA